MYNVVCLKWGDKFTPEYVNRLFYGVRRNTTVPFTFHCFTEDSTGLDPEIQIQPLKHPEIQGWWQKLYLFSDEVDIDGRVLFIDLDTLIVGNIDLYVVHGSGFAVMQDLWQKGKNVSSALMNFETHKHKHIWDSFVADPKAAIRSLHPHGDQKWIQKHPDAKIFWPTMYPNEIVSFKSDCRGGIPPKAKIICYHGKPSIIESMTIRTNVQRFVIPPTPWVAEYWKDE